MPLWSLGLWVSRAHYKTPEEAIDGGGDAARAQDSVRRARRSTAAPRGRRETRFDFRWDPERFADARAALAAIKAQHLRVCVWEYPYVSVHDPLFVELAARGFLLKNAAGDPLRVRLGHDARASPPSATC